MSDSNIPAYSTPQPAPQPQSVITEPVPVPAAPIPKNKEAVLLLPQKIVHRLVRPEFIEKLSELLFKFGFASIFLVNAVYAAIEPASFVDLLSTNMVGKLIGHADLLVKFVIFNDLIIGLFILFNIYKKITYIWAGTWLLIVAGIKMMNLLN